MEATLGRYDREGANWWVGCTGVRVFGVGKCADLSDEERFELCADLPVEQRFELELQIFMANTKDQKPPPEGWKSFLNGWVQFFVPKNMSTTSHGQRVENFLKSFLFPEK